MPGQNGRVEQRDYDVLRAKEILVDEKIAGGRREPSPSQKTNWALWIAIKSNGSERMANRANRMANQRSENQRRKQENGAERAFLPNLQRKAAKYHNPCTESDRSGIAGAPCLIEERHHTEGQGRNKTEHYERPPQEPVTISSGEAMKRWR